MDNTDPNYVSFELDTFWAMRGAWIRWLLWTASATA